MEPATSEGQILRAAAELFATQGFSKTTMAEVAEKACVSKGLPYVYFRSKRDLLDAVQMNAIAAWAAATEKHLKMGQEPAIEGLMKSFKYSILHSAKEPICRAIMAQDPKVLLPDSDKVKAEIRRLNNAGFKKLLEQAREDGDIRDDIKLDDLMLMWRVTHDTLIHIKTDTLSWAPQREGLEAIIESALDILFNGIVPRRANSKPSRRLENVLRK